MNKLEFWLYIKTFAYSFLVGVVFFLPFIFLAGLLFGAYDEGVVMAEEDLINLMKNNYYYISFYLVYLVLVSFPINTLTGNFFYKSLTNSNLNKQKVTKVFILITVVFSLIYLISSQLSYEFWWPEVAGMLVSTLLFVKIFTNVVNNEGKINYKNLFKF